MNYFGEDANYGSFNTPALSNNSLQTEQQRVTRILIDFIRSSVNIKEKSVALKASSWRSSKYFMEIIKDGELDYLISYTSFNKTRVLATNETIQSKLSEFLCSIQHPKLLPIHMIEIFDKKRYLIKIEPKTNSGSIGDLIFGLVI